MNIIEKLKKIGTVHGEGYICFCFPNDENTKEFSEGLLLKFGIDTCHEKLNTSLKRFDPHEKVLDGLLEIIYCMDIVWFSHHGSESNIQRFVEEVDSSGG